MLKLRLTSDPIYYDEYGQPCYPVGQEKGLIEFQGNHLLAKALADGYTQAVAEILLNWIREKIQLAAAHHKTLDILELGGGNGAFFERVEESANTYINVEPGRIALDESGLKRLSSAKYMCLKCSAEEIPLPDESADVIISIASLDHVPDYSRALAEARRLLRPGGLFIMTLNNRRSWWKTALARTQYLKRREEEIAREHYFQWSYAECESNLSKFIPVVEMRTVTYLPFVPKLWRYLLPASDFLGKRVLPKHGANIMAVCKKSG